jgi:hypothetical protein
MVPVTVAGAGAVTADSAASSRGGGLRARHFAALASYYYWEVACNGRERGKLLNDTVTEVLVKICKIVPFN